MKEFPTFVVFHVHMSIMLVAVISTCISKSGALCTTAVGSRGPWTNFPQEHKVEVHQIIEIVEFE
jgi:hypothetical protein